MPRTTHALAALLAVALIVPTLQAQDAKKPPPPTEFSGDLAIVSASGNTSTSTVSANERLLHRVARWEFLQSFGTVTGKTAGVQSSDLLRAGLRADYGIASRFAIYLLGAYDRDKFSGIDNRYGEGIGGVAKILANDADQLDLEAGYQRTQERSVDGLHDSFSSLRAATSYKHAFTKAAYFLQTAEFLPNLDDSKDLRINSETALAAPLSTHIAMKFDYTVRFDNEPALNAAGTLSLQKSDRIFAAGIQITY
jgi:putative salt-induced outer membrane protein YdiY